MLLILCVLSTGSAALISVSPEGPACPGPWRSGWSTGLAGLVCRGPVGGRAPRISPSPCLWGGWSWSCTWPAQLLTCGRCVWTCPTLENTPWGSSTLERGLDSKNPLFLLYQCLYPAGAAGIAVWMPSCASSQLFWSDWCRLWQDCGLCHLILSNDVKRNQYDAAFCFILSTWGNYYLGSHHQVLCCFSTPLWHFDPPFSLPPVSGSSSAYLAPHLHSLTSWSEMKRHWVITAHEGDQRCCVQLTSLNLPQDQHTHKILQTAGDSG